MSRYVIGIQREKQGFSARWAEALAARNCEVRWLDLLAGDALEQAAACHGVMWHFQHLPGPMRQAKTILHVIETELKIPVFPDLRTAWHFDDKAAQYYLLKAHNAPMPETWVFWRREDAEKWSESASYPVVAKTTGGAGSSGVFVVRSQREALAWIRQVFGRSGYIRRAYVPPKANLYQRAWAELRQFGLRCLSALPYVFFGRYPPLPVVEWQIEKDCVYFQELVPGNDFDTRITVIGNRAFGYRRMNRPHDFRASGSGVFDTNPAGVAMDCVRLAFEKARKRQLQSMACDILLHPRLQPVITEISYAYADWVVERCPGHWDADLHWHEGHMWPEEAHVEDFLKRIEGAAAVRS